MNLKVYEQDDGFLVSVDNLGDCTEVVKAVLMALSDKPSVKLDLHKIETVTNIPDTKNAKEVKPAQNNIALMNAIKYISNTGHRKKAESLSKTYGYSDLKEMIKAKNPAEIFDLYRILVITQQSM